MAVACRWGMLGWVTVVATACGGASTPNEPLDVVVDDSTPAQPIAGEALYTPGEYLAFKVKWKFLSGGSAQLVVGEPGTQKGVRSLVVRSVIKTEGLVAVFKRLRDELITTVDLTTGKPMSAYNTIESGKRRRSLEINYESGRFRYEHREAGAVDRDHKTVPAPSWVYDLHAALAHIRGWRPAPGGRGFLYAQTARTLFRVQLGHVGSETVKTPAGSFPSVRYDGIAQELKADGSPGPRRRKLSVWVSDDPRRLPIKLVGETEFGDVHAELVDHRQP